MFLSPQVEASVELPDFKGGKDFTEKITRAKFEELCLDLFKKTLLPVDKVLMVMLCTQFPLATQKSC